MLTKNQINNFISEIENAYQNEPHLITEDTIRALLIKAMNVNLLDIEIEVPYVVNSSKKIKGKKTNTPVIVSNPTWFNSERNRADIYYYSTTIDNGCDLCETRPIADDDMVIEVKYHRETPYSANCTTSKAGSVFNDLNRLSVIDNKQKFFVYVFDKTMKTYFDNVSRQFTDILKENAQNQTFTIDAKYDKMPQDAKNNAFRSFVVDSFSAFHTYQVKIISYNMRSVNAQQFNCVIVQVL